MVNNPNSVPPNNPQGPNAPKPDPKPKNTGAFQFSGEHKFLGMTFSASDWNKLMNSLLNNMSTFINKTYQKATEKMKKDWERPDKDD